MVEIHNKSGYKIDTKSVKKCAEYFLKYYKVGDKSVSIAFVNDSEIQPINLKYRGIDKPTDVLSFVENDAEDADDDFLGEIIINYEQIRRQAKESGKSDRAEMIFILVHGLLHLIGRTDEKEEDRQKMIKEGENFIDLMDKKNAKTKKARKKF